MADAAPGSLSNSFNKVAKFAFQAIVIGLIVGGIFDFTLFHNHPMGAAIIETVNEPMMSFYDGIASLFGLDHLTTAAAGPTYGEMGDMGSTVAGQELLVEDQASAGTASNTGVETTEPAPESSSISDDSFYDDQMNFIPGGP